MSKAEHIYNAGAEIVALRASATDVTPETPDVADVRRAARRMVSEIDSIAQRYHASRSTVAELAWTFALAEMYGNQGQAVAAIGFMLLQAAKVTE